MVQLVITLPRDPALSALNAWLRLCLLHSGGRGLLTYFLHHRARLVLSKVLLHELELCLAGDIFLIIKTVLPFCVLVESFLLLFVELRDLLLHGKLLLLGLSALTLFIGHLNHAVVFRLKELGPFLG